MYIKKMILASAVLTAIAQPTMATEAMVEAFSQTTTQETTTQTVAPVVPTAATTTPASTESYKETAEYQKDGSSTQAKYEYDRKVDQNSNGDTKVTTEESVTVKDEQK